MLSTKGPRGRSKSREDWSGNWVIVTRMQGLLKYLRALTSLRISSNSLSLVRMSGHLRGQKTPSPRKLIWEVWGISKTIGSMFWPRLLVEKRSASRPQRFKLATQSDTWIPNSCLSNPLTTTIHVVGFLPEPMWTHLTPSPIKWGKTLVSSHLLKCQTRPQLESCRTIAVTQ